LTKEFFHLQGDKNRLDANVEHLTSIAQGQSEENRELRAEIENLRSKIDASESTKREVRVESKSTLKIKRFINCVDILLDQNQILNYLQVVKVISK